MEEKVLTIAMFGQKHVLAREGGVEIAVKELAVRMAAKGHHVICYDRKSPPVNGAALDGSRRYGGVSIVTVWTVRRKGLAAVTSSFAAALISAFGRADIVHIHAEGPAAMCRLPKLTGKRVIVTVHGLDHARAKWGGFASKYLLWGEKQAVRHADEIIVLSRHMQEYFRNEYGRGTVFIPNGVTKPTIREADAIKEKWGLTKGSYVLFVGRLVPEKGLRILLEAWKELRTEKKLVIVGESSDTTEYAEELKRMSIDTVLFVGFQQGEVLDELYSNAFLFCLPSELEGMPLSLLEAMSYGSCCVVSDIPECAEIVEDKAVTFPKGDPDALRRTLQELLDDPARAEKYRRASAEFVLKKYSWDDAAEKTLELYRGRS